MNPENLYDYLLTVLGGLLTWFGKSLKDDVELQKKALGDFKEEIANERVHKNDLHILSEAIFRKLDRIEDKLDGKVDKK